jgi:hypothetical protein
MFRDCVSCGCVGCVGSGVAGVKIPGVELSGVKASGDRKFDAGGFRKKGGSDGSRVLDFQGLIR